MLAIDKLHNLLDVMKAPLCPKCKLRQMRAAATWSLTTTSTQTISGTPIRALPRATTPGWIERVLEDEGGELRVQEITDRIINAGYAGPNPDRRTLFNNVWSVLSRASKHPHHPVFKKTGRGMFDLRSRNSQTEVMPK